MLSPGTLKNDRCYKKDLYEKCGVKEYWIATPGEQTIEVYLLSDGKYVFDNVYTFSDDEELT